jgi:hypothetical protein
MNVFIFYMHAWVFSFSSFSDGCFCSFLGDRAKENGRERVGERESEGKTQILVVCV